MKRSESVLMYGVTGILLVILAVAVIFGSESKAAVKALPAKVDPDSSKGIFPINPVDPVDDEAGDDPEVKKGEDPVEPGPELDQQPKDPVVQVPLSIGQARVERSALGESEVTNFGELYRYITVRPNDSFDLLVERWTGSVSNREDVIALNEELRIHPLNPGARICMPYVNDEILLSAMEDRRRARASRPVSEFPPPAQSGRAPLSTSRANGENAAVSAVREVVLKKGESLWTIAEREVGRRGADAYIKRICALNGIDDAGRVQAKQKIKLPPKKAE